VTQMSRKCDDKRDIICEVKRDATVTQTCVTVCLSPRSCQYVTPCVTSYLAQYDLLLMLWLTSCLTSCVMLSVTISVTLSVTLIVTRNLTPYDLPLLMQCLTQCLTSYLTLCVTLSVTPHSKPYDLLLMLWLTQCVTLNVTPFVDDPNLNGPRTSRFLFLYSDFLHFSNFFPPCLFQLECFIFFLETILALSKRRRKKKV
jgi:hypothetical protein